MRVANQTRPNVNVHARQNSQDHQKKNDHRGHTSHQIGKVLLPVGDIVDLDETACQKVIAGCFSRPCVATAPLVSGFGRPANTESTIRSAFALWHPCCVVIAPRRRTWPSRPHRLKWTRTENRLPQPSSARSWQHFSRVSF